MHVQINNILLIPALTFINKGSSEKGKKLQHKEQYFWTPFP